MIGLVHWPTNLQHLEVRTLQADGFQQIVGLARYDLAPEVAPGGSRGAGWLLGSMTMMPSGHACCP